jgi:hypothetical protein
MDSTELVLAVIGTTVTVGGAVAGVWRWLKARQIEQPYAIVGECTATVGLRDERYIVKSIRVELRNEGLQPAHDLRFECWIWIPATTPFTVPGPDSLGPAPYSTNIDVLGPGNAATLEAYPDPSLVRSDTVPELDPLAPSLLVSRLSFRDGAGRERVVERAQVAPQPQPDARILGLKRLDS